MVAARGDRIVLRTRTTIGGGIVLDPAPPRGLDSERLALLDGGDAKAIVRHLAREPTTSDSLRARGLLTAAELESGLSSLAQTDNFYYRPEWLDAQRAAVAQRLTEQAAATPLDPGVSLAELFPGKPWGAAIVRLLDLDVHDGRAYLPSTETDEKLRSEDSRSTSTTGVPRARSRSRRGMSSVSGEMSTPCTRCSSNRSR